MDFIPGLSSELETKIVKSFVAIVVILFARWFVSKVVFKQVHQNVSRYYWQKSISITFNIVIVLTIFRIWFEAIDSIATYLGLLSAGLAIALKDPVANLGGWAFILWRRPFSLEDRIQIDNVKGDVIDMRLFQFTLLELGNWVDSEQSTGRIVHIPNSKVFTNPTYNYSAGFRYIWNEINVLVTFESDWKETKQKLTKILEDDKFNLNESAKRALRSSSKKFMIYYQNLTPKVYTTVKDSGVMFSMRFLCEPRKRRFVEELIWEQILEVVDSSPKIDLAYPTVRYYDTAKSP